MTSIYRDSTTYPGARQRYVSGYPLPDPLASWEGHQTFLHLDVTTMTPRTRWAHNQLAKRALSYIEVTGRDACIQYGGEHIPASTWLRERIRATGTGRP